MTPCRELDSNRSALSAASAFAIATAGANEGTPNKEKYRRMSLASAGTELAHHLDDSTTPGACPPSDMECLLPQALTGLSLLPGGPFIPTHPLCNLANLCLESSPLPDGCSATRSASHFHGGVEATRILQRPLKAAEVREKRACEDCVHRKLSHPDSLVRTWAGCQIFSHPPPRAPPSFPRLPQIWGFLSSLPSPLSVTCVPGFPPDQRNGDKEFVIRRAATNRVLNVLRHWVSKHSQVGGTPRDAPQSR